MSVSYSPSIVTKDLTLAIDQGNIKSYKGPPLTNFAGTITPQAFNGTGISINGSAMVIDIPGVGTTSTFRSVVQNNYLAFAPNSADCCPSPFLWQGSTISPSTLYTYLILYKCDSGYTSSNYMYRYESVSNGGANTVEGGVHNDTNRVHLGSGWYYAWGTFTTAATTTWWRGGSWYYRNSTIPDNFYVAKVALLAGDRSGLHPKYWPNAGITRSNTQAVLDLTGNSTVTATSLTYANDGTFSFNGSSNSIIANIPSFAMLNLSFWMYNNNLVPNNDTAIGGPSTYQSPINFGTSTYGVNLGGWTGSATNEAVHIWTNVAGGQMTYNRDAIPVGWHNLSFNWNGSNYDIWVDGIKTVVYPNASGHAKVATITSLVIGADVSSGYYFNGKISSVSTYRISLSDLEIVKNFNAQKRRYGV